MSPLLHGVDAVSVARIERMQRDHGQRFLDRCFSGAEQAYCLSHQHSPEHLAARFAAKEATLKALGTGLTDGIAWTDIEVERLPTGRPTLRLHNRATVVAGEAGVKRWLLSMSHTHDVAIASVIGVGE